MAPSAHQGIYPPDFAAMLVARAGEKYRPSNGTEGGIFTSATCDQCYRGKTRSCVILAATFAFDVEDDEYPTEWQYGLDGQPTCTAFATVETVQERLHDPFE